MKRFTHKISMAGLCWLIFSLLLSTSVQAESKSNDEWNFQLTPYVWLAGLKGKVATLPPLPPVDIDLNFYDDILENLKGALMLWGEARRGRLGLFTDIDYVHIEGEQSTPGPYFSSVKSTTKSWMVSGAGFYRVAQRKQAFLDLFAGIRYWSVNSELSLGGGLIGPRSISNTQDWVDPLVGLKGLMPIGGSRFFVSAAIAIGGFGAGSDFMWDANGNLGYRWTKGFSTTIGYRYLDVDYDDEGFLYDVTQQGIILGLSWRF